jgi:hypothetical protein
MTGFTWSFIIGASLNLIAAVYFIFISAPHYQKHCTNKILQSAD